MYDPQLLESLVRSDPAGRGLASARDPQGMPLCVGHLQRAAEHLALRGHRVMIVTGFAVVLDDRITAETDGPLGALFLASMLQAAGMKIKFATDRYAAEILRAGCAEIGLSQASVIEFSQAPSDESARKAVAAWRSENANSQEQFSHLVFIERVGPSHTIESIARSSSEEHRSIITAEFERCVPALGRDVCHNMRGESIDAYSAPLHELIELSGESRASPIPPCTIGVVDGGNEIGCGVIDWNLLRAVVAGDVSARIACRIATDYTIPAGVSNWGAYALGAAVVSRRASRRPEAPMALADWTTDKHRNLLRALVAAGAVDGVTKRAAATVDGISLDLYLAQFERIKAAAV
ncbi:MAG: hypothetical protein C0483_16855 [Pirellula sp.]|nr:hypothetical protein [Pirellula sp.]